MTLSAGSKLGPYEILAPLGAGGMGEESRTLPPQCARRVHREFIWDPDDEWVQLATTGDVRTATDGPAVTDRRR